MEGGGGVAAEAVGNSQPKLLGPVEGEGGGRSEGSEGRRWLVNAKMMNVHMVNESESYLQLGRHNADNISLTELLCSSLSSSPVVARLSPGCEAYVELVSDWQPFAPVPFCMALLHRYCLHWLV